MVEEIMKVEELFREGLKSTGNHPENCECVICSEKKWGVVGDVITRTKNSSTQKEILVRSTNADNQLIDEKKEKQRLFSLLREKNINNILQKSLIYFTGGSVFVIGLSLLYRLIFTQDYFSSIVHVVAIAIISLINERIS